MVALATLAETLETTGCLEDSMRQTEYPLIGSSIIAHGNLKCTYNVVMRGLESGNASSMQRFEILKRGKL